MAGPHTNLLYHIVFSTKQRLPLVTESIRGELYSYTGRIIRGEGGALIEIGGMSDHAHLLVKLRPVRSLSEMLRILKAKSSKWINGKLRFRKFGWQDGYAALTVSQSQVPRVRDYIRLQQQHHGKPDFRCELAGLLERHGIEYDEQYLWD